MAWQGRRIGEVAIARVLEMVMPFDPLVFFPETTRADWEPHESWLKPRAMDPASGALLFAVQSYLLRTAHRTILIDTCVGNHKERPNRRFAAQDHASSEMDLLRHIIGRHDRLKTKLGQVRDPSLEIFLPQHIEPRVQIAVDLSERLDHQRPARTYPTDFGQHRLANALHLLQRKNRHDEIE